VAGIEVSSKSFLLLLEHFRCFDKDYKRSLFPFQLSDLFCSTQGTQTQGSQASQFQRLVKRMTRFWVKTPPLETEKFLTGLLEKLCYTIKSKNKGIVSALDQSKVQIYKC